MGFLSFVLILAIAYLLWRISDQIPDILFRLSEMQRDIAEIRRRGDAEQEAVPSPTPVADEPATEEDDD
jgi:hypothetical protein